MRLTDRQDDYLWFGGEHPVLRRNPDPGSRRAGGLHRAARPTGGHPNTVISAEQLGLIDSDVVVVFEFGLDTGAVLAKLQAIPLWTNLPAVAAGKVIILAEDESYAGSRDSILTVPLQLDILERIVDEIDAWPSARTHLGDIVTTTMLTPSVDDATRREFIALLGAASLLSSCGK